MTDEKSTAVKVIALTAASLALLSACGEPKATPMDDDYADGTYSINGQYGPVGEDTIDVHLTVKDQNVTDVSIVGHPFTSISKTHQDAFAKAVPDAVVGKPLKDLKIDKIAGASWTTEAFNKALEVARQEASIQ